MASSRCGTVISVAMLVLSLVSPGCCRQKDSRKLQTSTCTPLSMPTVVLYAGPKEPSGYMQETVNSLPDDKKIDISPASTQYIKLGGAAGAPGPCAPQLAAHTGNLVVWEDGSLGAQAKVLNALQTFGGTLVLYGQPGRDAIGLSDLTALSNLKSVHNLFLYHLDGLSDLSGLDALSTVTGDLVVSNNDGLQSLRGLAQLTDVQADLVVNSNLHLASVDGLQSLQNVGDDLVIKGNGNLAALDRLVALRSVGGKVWIINNGDTHLTLTGLAPAPGGGFTAVKPPADGTAATESVLPAASRASGGRSRAGGSVDAEGYEHAGYSSPVLVLYGGRHAPPLAAVKLHVGDFMPPVDAFILDDSTVQFLPADAMVAEKDGVVRGHVVVWDDGHLPSFQTVLRGVTAITGQLVIIANKTLPEGQGVESLGGLEALQSVGGLDLVRLQALTDLTGLSGLTAIHGDLVLVNNAMMTSLVGLGPITKTRSDLWIDSNPRLVSVDGLQSLREVGYRMYIFSNSKLETMDGLSRLALVRQEMLIKHNSRLTSLAGLAALNTIGANVAIMWNARLVDLGLTNITQEHVDGDLIVTGNAALPTLAPLACFSSVRLNLLVSSNHAVTDLHGLERMQTVGSVLAINNNDNLRSLDGLSSLRVVGQELYIRDNGELTSLQSLGGSLRQVGDGPGKLGHIFIQDNARLHSLGGLQDALGTMLGGLAGVHIRGAIPQAEFVKLVEKDKSTPTP